jgi:hypothetical protein
MNGLVGFSWHTIIYRKCRSPHYPLWEHNLTELAGRVFIADSPNFSASGITIGLYLDRPVGISKQTPQNIHRGWYILYLSNFLTKKCLTNRAVKLSKCHDPSLVRTLLEGF